MATVDAMAVVIVTIGTMMMVIDVAHLEETTIEAKMATVAAMAAVIVTVETMMMVIDVARLDGTMMATMTVNNVVGVVMTMKAIDVNVVGMTTTTTERIVVEAMIVVTMIVIARLVQALDPVLVLDPVAVVVDVIRVAEALLMTIPHPILLVILLVILMTTKGGFVELKKLGS